jgi:hypothetical protein
VLVPHRPVDQLAGLVPLAVSKPGLAIKLVASAEAGIACIAKPATIAIAATPANKRFTIDGLFTVNFIYTVLASLFNINLLLIKLQTLQYVKQL